MLQYKLKEGRLQAGTTKVVKHTALIMHNVELRDGQMCETCSGGGC